MTRIEHFLADAHAALDKSVADVREQARADVARDSGLTGDELADYLDAWDAFHAEKVAEEHRRLDAMARMALNLGPESASIH